MNLVSSSITVLFLGALAIHNVPAETVANTEALQPSFDIAMPAQADPAEQLEAPALRFAANTAAKT